MNATELSPGTTILDRYEILSKLGVGGFGIVYKARQLSTGQNVAIKMLLGQRAGLVTEEQIRKENERFERECALVAELTHPNIVGLKDSGHFHEHRVMVLEFIEGHELSDLIKEKGSLDGHLCKRIISQVLEALSLAHSKGVIHRDLKPENIMLTGPASRPIAKVLDFGIAAVTHEHGDDWERLTDTGMVLGSVAFMAPEQLTRKSTTPQSDLYAIGLILFECLTGQRAFTGETPIAVAMSHVQQPCPPLPEYIRNGPFGAIIVRACAGNLEERYPDADSMLGELEAIDPSSQRSVTGSLAVNPDPFATPASTGPLQPDNPAQVRVGRASDPSAQLPNELHSTETKMLPGKTLPLEPAPDDDEPRLRPAMRPQLLVIAALALLVLIGGGVWLFDYLGSSPEATENTPHTDTKAPAAASATPEPTTPNTAPTPPTAPPATTAPPLEPTPPAEPVLSPRQRAELARQEARWSDAAAAYSEVLETTPNDALALDGLGWAQLELGTLDDAVTSFKAALATAVAPASSRFGLARTLEAKGDKKGARAAYELYLKANPEGPFASDAKARIEALKPKSNAGIGSMSSAGGSSVKHQTFID
ncbi:MAG: protein kinase [Myxococcota bacterium]|jgi:serine/threonine protein kinase|nr:protein kinase [Myxococcota bacterium]